MSLAYFCSPIYSCSPSPHGRRLLSLWHGPCVAQLKSRHLFICQDVLSPWHPALLTYSPSSPEGALCAPH